MRSLCYLRRRADRYLWTWLQVVRHPARFSAPPKSPFRPVIESYAANWPVTVRAYDRAVFPAADIAKDFIGSMFPEVPLETTSKDVNRAFPAEVASVLQQYRSAVHPDCDNVIYPEDDHLARSLSARAGELGVTRRPRLRSAVQRHIARQSADELAWLSEHYGIELRSEHPHEPGSDGDLAPSEPAFERIRDICPVDEEVERRLIMHTLHGYTSDVLALKAERRQALKAERHNGFITRLRRRLRRAIAAKAR